MDVLKVALFFFVLQDRFGLPAVCDLFSCLKLDMDKEKWLHQAPIQVRTAIVYEAEIMMAKIEFAFLKRK